MLNVCRKWSAYLLGVGDQSTVNVAELSLQLLFLGGQLACGFGKKQVIFIDLNIKYTFVTCWSSNSC